MQIERKIPRRLLAIGTAFALTLAIGGTGLGIGIVARRESARLIEALSRLEHRTTEEMAALSAEMKERPRSATEYLVKACAEGIGIYTENGTVLMRIIDTDLRTLPAADRAMLEVGIIVTGERALEALCADYSS